MSDRMAWIIVAGLSVLFLSAAVASGQTITPQALANDEVIKGRVLFGDPNAGSVGLWAGWNDAQPKDLWGAGVAGQFDISAQSAAVLSKFPGVPDTWWELLSELDGHVYLGLEIGAVNIAHGAEAMSSPAIGIRLGPITYELSYQIFEGGRVKDGGDVIAESGVKNFFGLQHVFRF